MWYCIWVNFSAQSVSEQCTKSAELYKQMQETQVENWQAQSESGDN